MKAILLACATIIGSAVGMYGFRIGNTRINELSPDTNSKSFPLLYAWIGMMAAEILVSLFMLIYYQVNMITVIKILMILSILFPCTWCDITVYLIPNEILLLAIVLRIGIFALEILTGNSASYLFVSAITATFGVSVVSIVCRLINPKSVGMGDVKLLAVMGLYLGIENTWNVMLCSMMILFVMCLGLLISKKGNRNTELPFAPFLTIGVVLSSLLMGF